MNSPEQIIEQAFEQRADLSPSSVSTETRNAILDAIEMLDSGAARVAEKKDGHWVVNQWLKKAVLLYFRIEDNAVVAGSYTNYYDKVPLKLSSYNDARFQTDGFRVVPPATVRKGAYVGPNVVMMPSYVNIGA